MSLSNLADIAYKKGQLSKARELLEAAAAICKEVGNQRRVAAVSIEIAFVMCDQEDQGEAKDLLQNNIMALVKLGDRERVADALYALGNAVARSAPRSAATLWSAGARLREELQIAETSFERSRHESWVARAHAALNDEAAFDASWREGREMSLDQAVKYALELDVNATDVRSA